MRWPRVGSPRSCRAANSTGVVATAPSLSTATGITGGTGGIRETTEYGAPRTAAANALTPYGFLGGKQRSDDSLAGLILMGVRLYNPTTGRFLSTDPVPGGNANTYTYPLDQLDLTGQFCKWCKKHSVGLIKIAQYTPSLARLLE